MKECKNSADRAVNTKALLSLFIFKSPFFITNLVDFGRKLVVGTKDLPVILLSYLYTRYRSGF